MAKAENYIENLTPREHSNLQKLPAHLLCTRPWAGGKVRVGKNPVPQPFENHYRRLRPL